MAFIYCDNERCVFLEQNHCWFDCVHLNEFAQCMDFTEIPVERGLLRSSKAAYLAQYRAELEAYKAEEAARKNGGGQGLDERHCI